MISLLDWRISVSLVLTKLWQDLGSTGTAAHETRLSSVPSMAILQATLQVRPDNQLVDCEISVVDGDAASVRKKKDMQSNTVEIIKVYVRNKGTTL